MGGFKNLQDDTFIGDSDSPSSYSGQALNLLQVNAGETALEFISPSSVGVTDHGALTGLADDDHTQYLLADGTRTLSADWDAGGFGIRALTLQSDIATGTSPLTIASTTLVANLNSDLLDSQEGTYYLDRANHTGVIDITDLEASLHTVIHSYNGSFLETFTFAVTSDGTTITGSLEQSGGGDLTMKFSDDFTALDTTPPATITITAGSDTSPQKNYVYIPQSTKVLTVSTTGFPTASEHIKIAEIVVQSASTVQTKGVLANRFWNDHAQGTDSQGHHLHAWERLRWEHSAWKSGSATTYTITTNAGSADNLDVAVTAGKIYQLHLQTTSAFDTATGSDVLVVNDSVSPYKRITDLASILIDSAGGSLSGRRFSLVLWGSISSSTQKEELFINLPSGSYGRNNNAIKDINGYDSYSIPTDFRGYAYLISRITIRHRTTSGGTWSILNEDDLRGLTPDVIAGSGTSASNTNFADSQFIIFDDVDNTKEVMFQASGLTTGTTRTLTIQDADGTIAYTADIISDHTLLSNIGTNTHVQIDTHIAGSNPHSGSAGSGANTDIISLGAITDIDSGASNLNITANATGELVFNDAGEDVDIRIESAVDTHQFFMQGNDGVIGIGTSTPTISGTAGIDITGNGTAGVNNYGSLSLKNPRNSGNDLMGAVDFYSSDGLVSKIDCQLFVGGASGDSQIRFWAWDAGVLKNPFTIPGDGNMFIGTTNGTSSGTLGIYKHQWNTTTTPLTIGNNQTSSLSDVQFVGQTIDSNGDPSELGVIHFKQTAATTVGVTANFEFKLPTDSNTATTQMTLDNTGKLSINSLDISTSTVISSVLDEDNMVSDSATALATQQSIKAYADAITPTSLGLVIGADVQAWDPQLDDIAGLAVTDGNFIVANGFNWIVESGATARTSLGLGSIATQNSNSVTITGGSITGITDLAIADGGTGSSTAQTAIDALTQVSGATNEHVLTKDTATGNAIWKVASGSGSIGRTMALMGG